MLCSFRAAVRIVGLLHGAQCSLPAFSVHAEDGKVIPTFRRGLSGAVLSFPFPVVEKHSTWVLCDLYEAGDLCFTLLGAEFYILCVLFRKS